MSYLVTRLVRAAQLPRFAHRPTAKAILLVLADKANDRGGGAFPSVDTLAREAEVSRRTVHAYLAALRTAGLLVEQRPATQHRPRTWRIDLTRLAAFIDPAATVLRDADVQLVESLTAPLLPFGPETSRSGLGVQVSRSGVQLSHSGVQPVAPERSERSLNQIQKLPKLTRYAALGLRPEDLLPRSRRSA